MPGVLPLGLSIVRVDRSPSRDPTLQLELRWAHHAVLCPSARGGVGFLGGDSLPNDFSVIGIGGSLTHEQQGCHRFDFPRGFQMGHFHLKLEPQAAEMLDWDESPL